MNGAIYDLVMNLMRGFFEKVGWFYGVQQYFSYIVLSVLLVEETGEP
jgi:hypothetical protein